MYWNYRVIKTKIKDQELYKVVEVFYDDSGKIDGWSDCTDTILIWSNLKDLQDTAEHVVNAFKKPVLLHIPEDNDALIEEVK